MYQKVLNYNFDEPCGRAGEYDYKYEEGECYADIL